ncbi:S-adenosyl-L-methionine-dependent methyltransferase [Mycena sp. CBHHK59/15]|nr:S-adenosyl-L-methionine-dependent methyltransferase [Mycena sp. CBHHK59/15]
MSPSPSPLQAPPHILSLLDRLHTLSSTQEAAIDDRALAQADFDAAMRDKFIALDQDKCHFMYQLVRATGATHVVEAGTSFGVSTIYLALAVGQNVKAAGGGKGVVIATEKESTKAAIARDHWKQAGESVTDFIDLREGDLLQTLKSDLPQIDMLLLDIWVPMALPTLQVVLPNLRPGAVVLIDNTISLASPYAELLAYLRAPESPFTNLTLPYSNGFEMCVYHPSL